MSTRRCDPATDTGHSYISRHLHQYMPTSVYACIVFSALRATQLLDPHRRCLDVLIASTPLVLTADHFRAATTGFSYASCMLSLSTCSIRSIWSENSNTLLHVVLCVQLDQLAAEGPAGPAAAPPAVVLDALLAAPRAMHQSATAALDRCESQTANLHLPDLLPVLDTALARTISRLQERVHSVATAAAAASASVSDSEDVQQLLRLPLACDSLQNAVAEVDAVARVRLSSLAPLAAAAAAGEADALEAEVRRAIPDQRAAVVVWRLTEGSISADKLAIAQAGVGEVILPKAFAAVSALGDVTEKALLEILSKPCRTAIAEVCLIHIKLVLVKFDISGSIHCNECHLRL